MDEAIREKGRKLVARLLSRVDVLSEQLGMVAKELEELTQLLSAKGPGVDTSFLEREGLKGETPFKMPPDCAPSDRGRRSRG